MSVCMCVCGHVCVCLCVCMCVFVVCMHVRTISLHFYKRYFLVTPTILPPRPIASTFFLMCLFVWCFSLSFILAVDGNFNYNIIKLCFRQTLFSWNTLLLVIRPLLLFYSFLVVEFLLTLWKPISASAGAYAKNGFLSSEIEIFGQKSSTEPIFLPRNRAEIGSFGNC